jgi:5-hydroxyisourate hydrolase
MNERASGVSTHVLDAVRGEPAAGIVVRLERVDEERVSELGRGATDADGRIGDFGTGALRAGTYRLVFATGPYLEFAHGDEMGGAPFFPEVAVTFAADGHRPRYHVPLLLSPFCYSTYRGS